MKSSLRLLPVLLLLLSPVLCTAVELLQNSDFSQDWSTGWNRTQVPETLKFAHITVESGELNVHTKGQGGVALYQHFPYQRNMDFSFRAWMESRENLFGLGVPGMPYVGIELLNGQGEKLGGLYWMNFTGFATQFALSGIRFPDPELRVNYTALRSQTWTENEVDLDQQIRDFLPAVDPAQIGEVAVVLGVYGPTDDSEGTLKVDWASLVVPSPQLSITAWSNTLNFFEVEAGTERNEWMNLSNWSPVDVVIDSLTYRGEGFALLASDQGGSFTPLNSLFAAPVTLRPGGTTINMSIKFAPATAKVYQGTITIYTNDPRSPIVMVLQGQGIFIPRIQLRAELSFPPTLVGQAYSMEFPVENTGSGVLQLAVDQVPMYFAVSPTTAAIAPGETLTFSVTFAPRGRQSFTRYMRISSNDHQAPAVQVLLSGEGLAPLLQAPDLSNGAIDLGRVQRGATKTYAFPITNAGNAPLEVHLETDHPAFAVQPDSTRLQPGQELQARVTFRDTISGPASTLLTLRSNDPDQPLVPTAIRVTNNTPPVVRLKAIPARVAGVVTLSYALSDPDRESLTLTPEWSADGGRTWDGLPIRENLRSILPSGYSGTLHWNTLDVPGYGLHSVVLRLSVDDGYPGAVVQDTVTIENVAGDYNFDRLVSDGDVPLFRTAFVQQDLSREIGPAQGQQPYLIPQPDKVMDIEDVQVMVSQLKWFRGKRPAGKVAPPIPPQVVVQEKEGWGILALSAGEIAAGALELVLEGAIDGLSVQPGPGVEPGLLFVRQAGHEIHITAGLRELAAGMELLRWEGSGVKGYRYKLTGEGFGAQVGQSQAILGSEPILSLEVSPNPFNASTAITYVLPRPTEVGLTIYDLLGRPVWEMARSLQAPGTYRQVWDGRDQAGKVVASGVYFAVLTGLSPQGEFRKNVRMMLLK